MITENLFKTENDEQEKKDFLKTDV